MYCAAMLEIELNTSARTQSSGGMWCHFTHSAMSVNQFITSFFFLSVTSSYTVRVISVQLVWIQIMLAFLSAVGAAREKQVGKNRE